MKYFKDRPIGLWILAVSVILFTIYYHIRPFLWGADISIYSPMFEFTPWGFFIWLNIILEIIGIYAVTYGFYYKKNWARLYTIAFTCFSSFWTLCKGIFWGKKTVSLNKKLLLILKLKSM